MALKAVCGQTQKNACWRLFHISIISSLKNSGMNKNRPFFAPFFNSGQHPKHSQLFNAVHFLRQNSFQLNGFKIEFFNTILQYSYSSHKKTVPQRNSKSIKCEKRRAPK